VTQLRIWSRPVEGEAQEKAQVMGKRHFFKPPKGLTVGEIVALTGAQPRAGARLDQVMADIAALDRAGPSDLVFVDSHRQAEALTQSCAGACLTTEQFESAAPAGTIVLRTSEPYPAFVAVVRALYPEGLHPASLFEGSGVAEGAIVHSSARVEDEVTVDPGAVIGPRAGIGARTVIGATAVIGPDVQVGRDCAIGPGVSIMHALIGDNVVVHAGCRIGQAGLHYHAGAAGGIKVPQVGRVIVQDHVEIGANTTIDRGGGGGDTVIGEGSRIDNLVQIAENVTIGRHCTIVSECGLAGGVTLGDHVTLGGEVGVADHLTIGEGAVIGARSAVVADVPPGAKR
jgi:UDP-3-O-[3-hydroxymyristoyl] glucosamine N-acyltransferase